MIRKLEINWEALFVVAMVYFFLGLAAAVITTDSHTGSFPLPIGVIWIGPYVLATIGWLIYYTINWLRNTDTFIVRRIHKSQKTDLRETQN